MRAKADRSREEPGIAPRLFGMLLMLSALAIPLMHAPDRPVETLIARWAPPPSDFIDLHGQLVHLRDEGPRIDPVPIVLLHGFAGSLHDWQGWTARLRIQRRVIRIDLPGFGLTGPFSGRYAGGGCAGDAHARFMLDLLGELKLGPVVLAGQGFGGEVAWRTASLAPARVQRLILVDATGTAVPPQAVPAGYRLAAMPGLHVIGEWLLPKSLVDSSLRELYGDPAKVSPEQVDRVYELALRGGNREALSQCLMQPRGGDEARLAALKLPTLILWGGRDRWAPPAAAQRFHEAISGSELVAFDTLGHLPQIEDPAATLAAVGPFVGVTP